jgi:hypothetical protein
MPADGLGIIDPLTNARHQACCTMPRAGVFFDTQPNPRSQNAVNNPVLPKIRERILSLISV